MKPALHYQHQPNTLIWVKILIYDYQMKSAFVIDASGSPGSHVVDIALKNGFVAHVLFRVLIPRNRLLKTSLSTMAI